MTAWSDAMFATRSVADARYPAFSISRRALLNRSRTISMCASQPEWSTQPRGAPTATVTAIKAKPTDTVKRRVAPVARSATIRA